MKTANICLKVNRQPQSNSRLLMTSPDSSHALRHHSRDFHRKARQTTFDLDLGSTPWGERIVVKMVGSHLHDSDRYYAVCAHSGGEVYVDSPLWDLFWISFLSYSYGLLFDISRMIWSNVFFFYHGWFDLITSCSHLYRVLFTLYYCNDSYCI